jgi:signal transduction histidine kinase
MSSDIGIDLQIEPQGHQVMMDPAELDHIIMNLVLSARDAMPNGGTVTVASTSRTIEQEDAAEHGVEPGEYMSLTVSDTGAGIHEDVLGRIFEPFFTTKGQGGVGLGLGTVHGAVGQAGGWVDVQTEPGAGTTFHVTLPTQTDIPAKAGTTTISAGPATLPTTAVYPQAAR